MLDIDRTHPEFTREVMNGRMDILREWGPKIKNDEDGYGGEILANLGVKATLKGRDEVVRILTADVGLDPNQQDAMGETAALMAVWCRNPELYSFLVAHGYDAVAAMGPPHPHKNPLHTVANINDDDTVDAVFDAGAYRPMTDENQAESFRRACKIAVDGDNAAFFRRAMPLITDKKFFEHPEYRGYLNFFSNATEDTSPETIRAFFENMGTGIDCAEPLSVAISRYHVKRRSHERAPDPRTTEAVNKANDAARTMIEVVSSSPHHSLSRHPYTAVAQENDRQTAAVLLEHGFNATPDGSLDRDIAHITFLHAISYGNADFIRFLFEDAKVSMDEMKVSMDEITDFPMRDDQGNTTTCGPLAYAREKLGEHEIVELLQRYAETETRQPEAASENRDTFDAAAGPKPF